MNELHLCMGCMSPHFEEGVCGVCGYDAAHTQIDINYLSPGSPIGIRYLVGRLTSGDTEGAWYVGYDAKESVRVWVREYAPKTITMRDYDTGALKPLAGSEAQYKALMADFEDLCKGVARLPAGEKVIPLLDLVYANNTVYAIYRYIKMISLESFLKRSGGKLPWRHAKKLLMPLFHTVENVHGAGLIHRGLSPRTVELDQSGALWLTCFSVAAARTNKSELTAQLYDGYAAPEQYSLNSWQGTWTDVYALGAITYRTVMGKDPPSAQDRVYGDDLLDSLDAGVEMPETVISAINHALAVEVEDRTQTAEAFIADLLANEGSNTAVYTAPPPRKRDPYPAASRIEEEAPPMVRRPAAPVPAPSNADDERPPRRNTSRYAELLDGPNTKDPETIAAQKAALRESANQRRSEKRKSDVKKKKPRKSHPALLSVLSTLVATALLGVAVYWFANNYLGDLLDMSPKSSSESESAMAGVEFSQDESDDGKVPQFVGITYDSIEANAVLALKYQFNVVEAFNADYDPGVVYDQKPLEGTEMISGGEITLFVSKGPEKVELPPVLDKPIEDVKAQLTELGIKYQVIEVYNNSYEPDVVVRCDRMEGEKIDKNKDTVILYIKRVETSSKEDSSVDEEDRPTKSSSKSSAKSSSSKSSSSKSSTKSSSGGGLLKPRG